MIAIKKKHWILIALLMAFLFVLVSSVAAVDNIQDLNQEINKQQEPDTSSTNLWLSLLQLVLVLGVILAAAWSVIRLFGKKVNNKMQGTWMHVVDEVVLGQNRGIVLCEVGGQIYALGVTDKEINLLFEVNDPKLQEEISLGNYELSSGGQENWNQWWNDFSQRFRFKKNSPPPMKFQSIMQEQNQRIKEIAQNNNHARGSGAKRSGENE